MTFERGGLVFNLLDTPGHEDFSEDTYRTLTAVDAAVMVLDAAKGIEAQTRKLFEVCRLANIPIITFINKMDREARDPFELIDEIEKTLALDAAPVAWPVGRRRSSAGTYDMLAPPPSGPVDATDDAGRRDWTGPDDPRLVPSLVGENARRPAFREILRWPRPPARNFDAEAFREGHLTPVFFGSALRDFRRRPPAGRPRPPRPVAPRPRADARPSRPARTG
jgi:peptide chain release factor 3